MATDPNDPPPTGVAILDEVLDALSLRGEMLAALVDGPVDKPTLGDRLDVSRSTVDRGLRRLESLEMVERTGEGYVATPAGRKLLAEYRSFSTRAASIVEAHGVLSVLPPSVPLHPDFLLDAEVVERGPPAPIGPGSTVGDLVSGADRLTGLTKAHSTPGAAERFHEEVGRGLVLEIVFERRMFDGLVDRYDWIGEAIADGRLRPHVVDRVPYGLFVVERDGATTAALLAYDDDLALRGAILNDDPDAVDWARSTFERYRRRAERPDPGE